MRLTAILIGGLSLGCDVASGLDQFELREEEPVEEEEEPCAAVPRDDFARLDDQWKITGTASVSSKGGELAIVAPPGERGGIESVEAFDFTGCQVHVELVTPPGVTGHASFLLALPGGDYVGFVSDETGKLRMGMSRDPTLARESTLVDALSPAWWRLRHASSDLVFETSTDGAIWKAQRTIAAPVLDDAVMILAGEATEIAPTEVTTAFDNLGTGD